MGTEGSTVLEPLWQTLPSHDASSVSGSASCALPPRYEAVKGARDFTRETLQRWGLEEEFDGIALVVSELVTNALRHGLPLTPAPEDGPPVRLHLMCWSARLVCAVRDPSDEPPEPPVAAGAAGPTGAAGAAGSGSVRGSDGSDAEDADDAVPDDPAGIDGLGGPGGPGSTGILTGLQLLDDPGGLDDLDDLEGLGDLDGMPGFEAESGRGLRLVQCFSDSWGWHPLSGTQRGKIVWARFRLGA